MQLSFDPRNQSHELSVHVSDDEINGGYYFQIVIFNRSGDVIASYGTRLEGLGVVEALPNMLHLAGLNFLYLDATAAIRDVKDLVAERRREMRTVG